MSTTTTSFFQTTKDIDETRHPILAHWHSKSIYFFDLPMILLMILIVCIGIAMGLTAFYGIQKKTDGIIRDELNKYATTRTAQFSNDVNNFLLSLTTLKAAFELFHSTYNVSTDPLDFGPTEFKTFVNDSHLLGQGFAYFSWHPAISQAVRSDFVNSLRVLGGDYSDYEVFPFDSRAVPVPTDYTTYDMFPTAYIIPQSRDILGLDPSTEERRRNMMIKAVFDRVQAITPRILLTDGSGFGFQVFDAVWRRDDPQVLAGFVRGVFRMRELMASLGFTELDVHVGVFDTSAGIYPNETYVYTTLTNIDTTTITNSTFYSKKFFAKTSIAVADREWTIYYTPKNRFLSVGDDSLYSQWIALWVIIGGCFVIAAMLLGLIITKHIVIKNYVQMAFREKVSALQDNNNKLETLLDRIAMEEHRTRGVMNAVPYAILVVNQAGKFLEFNKQFRTVFGQGEKGLSKTLFTQIFPLHANPDDLFAAFQSEPGKWLPMKLQSKFGNDVPSEVSVSKSQAMVGSKEDNLYIIIINALEGKNLGLLNRSYLDAEQAFYKTIEDPELRSKFKDFCLSHHNAESIMFIEDVLEYKKQPNTMERVAMQEQIFNTYLSLGSKHELNLPRNVVNNELALLQNGLGQITVFDNIFNTVCTLLMQDAFNLYQKQQQMQERPNSSATNRPQRTVSMRAPLPENYAVHEPDLDGNNSDIELPDL